MIEYALEGVNWLAVALFLGGLVVGYALSTLFIKWLRKGA